MNQKIFIILTALFFYCMPANAQSLPSQIFGNWQVVNPQKNIFEGNVHILAVKSKPGAMTTHALLIYDDTQKGFLCSILPFEGKGWVCGAAYITKTNVTPEDRSDLVTQAFPDLEPVIINFEQQKDTLAVIGCALTNDDCIDTDKPNYRVLGLLKR